MVALCSPETPAGLLSAHIPARTRTELLQGREAELAAANPVSPFVRPLALFRTLAQARNTSGSFAAVHRTQELPRTCCRELQFE